MRITFWMSICCLFILLTGCQATHLIYVSDASLGIDLSVTAEGRSKFSVGYDRFTGAIVPRRPDRGSTPGDAMTLTSFSSIVVTGIDDVEFHHFIATGESAKKVAEDAETLKAMREALYGATEDGGP